MIRSLVSKPFTWSGIPLDLNQDSSGAVIPTVTRNDGLEAGGCDLVCNGAAANQDIKTGSEV